MRKIFIFVGILFLAIGLFYPFIKQLPIGKLPGDIVIDKPNLKVYIPITSMIVLSILISALAWLFKKLF